MSILLNPSLVEALKYEPLHSDAWYAEFSQAWPYSAETIKGGHSWLLMQSGRPVTADDFKLGQPAMVELHGSDGVTRFYGVTPLNLPKNDVRSYLESWGVKNGAPCARQLRIKVVESR